MAGDFNGEEAKNGLRDLNEKYVSRKEEAVTFLLAAVALGTEKGDGAAA